MKPTGNSMKNFRNCNSKTPFDRDQRKPASCSSTWTKASRPSISISFPVKTVKSFSFIIADPDFKADYKEVDFKTLYAAEDIINIEDEEELRRVLEELPCCTTNADGDEYGDPLNLVLIGERNDIVPALVRRDWHATEIIWSQAIITHDQVVFTGRTLPLLTHQPTVCLRKTSGYWLAESARHHP